MGTCVYSPEMARQGTDGYKYLNATELCSLRVPWTFVQNRSHPPLLSHALRKHLRAPDFQGQSLLSPHCWMSK